MPCISAACLALSAGSSKCPARLHALPSHGQGAAQGATHRTKPARRQIVRPPAYRAQSGREAANTPKAIGKSKRPDSFGKSAGQINGDFFGGNEALARQKSPRARGRGSSFTSVSGRPTMLNAGKPLAKWASTSTHGVACRLKRGCRSRLKTCALSRLSLFARARFLLHPHPAQRFPPARAGCRLRVWPAARFKSASLVRV